MSTAPLQVQVLGPLAIQRDGENLRLTQSKKTRALLAYLAITGRAHRRDRLCSLLWDVADDPRGALRWSLSKIRALVDGDDDKRLLADRESVELPLDDRCLDLFSVRRTLAQGVGSLPLSRLEELATIFRGELLEGLDLIDFDEFTAWCAAERQQARLLQEQVLSALVDHSETAVDRAVEYARELVRIDPVNEESRARLIRLLGQSGRRQEARIQYESGSRLLKELGATQMGLLASAVRELDDLAGSRESAEAPVQRTSVFPEPPPAGEVAGDVLVGREAEVRRLVSVLDDVAERGELRVFLLMGESGVGKTRLLTELAREARQRGSVVFEGTAYEAEANRPYGPWIDALRRLPRQAVESDHQSALASLLPELADGDEAPRSRDRLFGAVVDLVARQAQRGAPALVLFDDVHWCDGATAELLHYVSRMSRNRSVAVVLGARDGELVDNETTIRILRSFRRDGLLEEHLLLPLSERDVAELIRSVGSEADAAKVFAQSGGNPLLARELARGASGFEGTVPSSLKELISDRIGRVPPEAADVLRWGAVLGLSFDVSRLSELVSLDLDPLMNALSALERYALLESSRDSPTGIYSFHHDLVYQVVYSEISEPRRRLMHLRVARVLAGHSDPDGRISMELAHHASLGGDAETAARACVTAGTRCLRIFANNEAYAHARRGLRYAETLPEPERLKLRLELNRVSYWARRPEDAPEAARSIEALADEALDAGCAEHAHLGYNLVSYLRWEGGEFGEAQRLSLRAEFASRGGDDNARILGMAEAARCLAVLERDLGQAESLLLEARAMSERVGQSSWSVYDGVGLLRLHGGELDEADESFQHAWALARKSGNRLQEFLALEHLVVVAIQRNDADQACEYARDLAAIGEKLREGSEAPLGSALLALCRYNAGEDDQLSELESALVRLREVDAKQRLAFVLGQAARVDLERGELDRAKERAEEAVSVGLAISRATETALAYGILLRIARLRKDAQAIKSHIAALKKINGYAHHVRQEIEREFEHLRLVPGEITTQDEQP